MRKLVAGTLDGSALRSRKQVAAQLGVCRETIKRLQYAGKLKAIIFNSRLLRYRQEDIEALIAGGAQ